MFKIDRDTLYTREDLAKGLEPLGVHVDTFTARLRARKVFRQCWLGADLIEALQAAPALGNENRIDGLAKKITEHRPAKGGMDTSALDRLIKG